MTDSTFAALIFAVMVALSFVAGASGAYAYMVDQPCTMTLKDGANVTIEITGECTK